MVPWLIGILTFISFEALGLVYANVLKDQIFGVSFRQQWFVVDNFPVEINENPDSTRKLSNNYSGAIKDPSFLRFLPTALRCLRQNGVDVLSVSNIAECKHKKLIAAVKTLNEQFPISCLCLSFSLSRTSVVAGDVVCDEILSHVALWYFVENERNNYRALT